MIVILSCGKAKAASIRPARALYTGCYFRACLAHALSVSPPGRCLILSAKHGLLGLDDPIAPYDLRMGRPGSVTPARIAEQAGRRGLAGPILSLCGASYNAALIAAGLGPIRSPFAGLARDSMGARMALLRSNRGRAPGA